MQFALDPGHVLSVADGVRAGVDDLEATVGALSAAVRDLRTALARLPRLGAAFAEVAGAREAIAHGAVMLGRHTLSALEANVRAYLAADEDMAHSTDTASGRTPLFDPARFGPAAR